MRQWPGTRSSRNLRGDDWPSLEPCRTNVRGLSVPFRRDPFGEQVGPGRTTHAGPTWLSILPDALADVSCGGTNRGFRRLRPGRARRSARIRTGLSVPRDEFGSPPPARSGSTFETAVLSRRAKRSPVIRSASPPQPRRKARGPAKRRKAPTPDPAERPGPRPSRRATLREGAPRRPRGQPRIRRWNGLDFSAWARWARPWPPTSFAPAGPSPSGTEARGGPPSSSTLARPRRPHRAKRRPPVTWSWCACRTRLTSRRSCSGPTGSPAGSLRAASSSTARRSRRALPGTWPAAWPRRASTSPMPRCRAARRVPRRRP